MYALFGIEILLQSNGRSLYYYSTMTQPDMSLIPECKNKLIDDELNYDKKYLTYEHIQLMSTMTSEKRRVYDTIMARENEKNRCIFYLWL